MKLVPWNLDAYRTFIGGATEDQLLVNRPIREFLDDEDKFILVGAKGLGKTLFLRYKSYIYHEKYGDSIRFNESNNELTENLYIHPDTFTKEELLQFKEVDLWQIIWQLALWIMVFRIWKLPLNPKLEKLIDKAEQLSTILTRLLNNRRKMDQYKEFVVEFQENKKKIQSAVAIFIDDVDQALHNFLLTPHHSDEYFKGKESPSVAVWVNAQIGLVSAIYNFKRQNSHIKIYATIRREAWEALEDELKINYLQHTSLLQYEKDEIKIIFEKNIQLVDPSDLIDPYSKATPLRKFLGFDEMEHRFAKDPSGNKRVENTFDFIFRHTYGRPREIVLIGRKINEKIVSVAYKTATEAERIEKIRVLVNQISHELFKQYKQEIIPYLDEDWLSHFLEKVRSNVITKDNRIHLNPETIRTYFNIGLIGYAHTSNHDGMMKQYFNPPATYNYRSNQSIPDYDFLMIHSTMDALLLEKHTYGNFYNKYNIIGHGYDFFPKVDSYIQRIEHYLPVSISGNRMDARSDAGGHAMPLKDIYAHFFYFDKYPQNYEKLIFNWESAKLILGYLGRICYCYRLEKQFDSDYYYKKRIKYTMELGKHQIVRKYNSAIATHYKPNDLNRFLDKLIGRYITLGCYLILDIRIEWIHQLLTSGNFDFNEKLDSKKKSSAFSYLSRSFFINELKSEEPRNPENPDHTALKNKIFNQLSQFEKEGIRSFAESASDEVSYLDWIEEADHKKWLTENCVNQLWKPTLL